MRGEIIRLFELKILRLHPFNRFARARLDYRRRICGIYNRAQVIVDDERIRYISEEGVITEDRADSMIEAFAGQSDLAMVTRRIFDGFSNDLRPKKLRDIDFPIAAEIYDFSI